MAPRRRRSKVGLTRMHAALDAMRQMGFSSDIVRQSVRKLLKVYGDDGWAFIEDAAYKTLIETILDEPEPEPEQEQEQEQEPEPEPEHTLVEGGSHGNNELAGSVPEPCDQEITCEGNDTNTGMEEKSLEHDLDAQPTPILVQDMDARRQVGVQQIGCAISYTPQLTDGVPTNRRRRPCYGWISDDDDADDDDFVQLTPAKRTDISW